MARRIMGFALLYAMLVLLAPSDADGAVLLGAAAQNCPAAGLAAAVPASLPNQN